LTGIKVIVGRVAQHLARHQAWAPKGCAKVFTFRRANAIFDPYRFAQDKEQQKDQNHVNVLENVIDDEIVELETRGLDPTSRWFWFAKIVGIQTLHDNFQNDKEHPVKEGNVENDAKGSRRFGRALSWTAQPRELETVNDLTGRH
jgi:hypothetical protein